MPVTPVVTPITTPEGSYVHPTGVLFEFLAKIALSGAYETGGFALDLRKYFQKIGKGDIYFVSVPPVAGYSFEYDYTNRKVMILFGDYSNAADGPGVEIPAATLPVAVSGATLRLLAKGR